MNIAILNLPSADLQQQTEVEELTKIKGGSSPQKLGGSSVQIAVAGPDSGIFQNIGADVRIDVFPNGTFQILRFNPDGTTTQIS